MIKHDNKEYIRELAHKWRNGTLTSEERTYFEKWDKSHADDILNLDKDGNTEEILNRLLVKVSAETSVKPVRILKFGIGLRTVAAAIAIIIVGSSLYYFRSTNDKNQSANRYLNDVAPGKQGATLTLANGQKIRLSDATNGELAKEAGISITKTANGQLVYEIKGTDGDPNKINTLSTANGETYEVRLPDGSLVHLNAASSLTYSVSLMEKGKRVVVLMGEGYFEIAKDKKHPFIVKTAQQEVEVLGTHFNIMAYKDEPIIATTLVEGSVKVRAAGKEWVLKPDEQALNTGNQIKVGPADIEHITDWKNGDFNLNKVNLRVAMRKIARWYNVQVVYEEEVSEDILAGGWVSRSQKLSTILNSLEKSGLAKFQIKGNTVYVSQ